jgi:hypothetical protein
MTLTDIFSYNTEYFSSLNRDGKTRFIKKFINNIVLCLNDPLLIKKEEQPNQNIIYHLYSDGTITRQKGGWAYGNRSTIDVEYEIIKPNTFFTFPLKGVNEGDTYTIMSLEDCQKVRNLMNALLLHI